jgi:dTDP-4-amino-4,6-dideoxygalactose transaminase
VIVPSPAIHNWAKQHVNDTGFVLHRKSGQTATIVCPLYVIHTENGHDLREHVSQAGISTVLNYPKALPLFPAYVHLSHVPKDFPVAYFNQSHILPLPIFPEITKEMITDSWVYPQFLSGKGQQPMKIAHLVEHR